MSVEASRFLSKILGKTGSAFRSLFSLSIRNRILILVFVAVFPTLLLVVYTDFEQRINLTHDVSDHVLTIAQLVAADENRLIDGTKAMLQTAARTMTPFITDGSCDKILTDFLKNYPVYANMGFADMKGDIICSAVSQAGINITDRRYFRDAITTGTFSVGEYQIGRITGKPSINFGYPVLDAAGRVNGVLFAALNLTAFDTPVKNINLSPGSSFVVIDRNSTVLERYPDPGTWVGRTFPDLDIFKTILQKGTEGITRGKGLDGIDRLYAFTPISDLGIYISLGVPTSEVFGVANWIFARNLIVLALLVVLLFILAFAGVNSVVMSQVNVLLKTTRRLASGDLLARTRLTKKSGELGELGESFDGMAESLKIEMQNALIFRKATDYHAADILITKADGTIIYANPSWLQQNGYAFDEIIGKKPNIAKSDKTSDKIYKDMWEAISSGRSFTTDEITNKRKDGTEYQEKLSISPILENGKSIFYVSVAEDISKHKAVDRAKSEFVSLASHQLRTPVSIINWYAEMLIGGEKGQISGEQKKYLEEIYKASRRMGDLVTSLLDVSRLEMGGIVVQPEPSDLSVISRDVVKDFEQIVAKKKIVISEDYDKTLSQINIDPKLIRIVFQNLISNSVKYIGYGGNIKLTLAKKDKEIVASVEDDGCGIPEAEQSKIFTKLFRAENARTVDPDGTGLGLYIVKMIVNLLGGKVWFESSTIENGTKTRGTKFFVSLPLTGVK